ncbi:MAG: type III restriction endonuclease subunit M, partial [Fusobacterium necrophorum]|nr:type III restriction endonuclease subunit M [Fusobacterium necrophorum]
SELDVLYEILLKYGLDLNIEIEANKDFYSIGGGTLLLNLQKELTMDTINSICEEYRKLLEIDKDFKTAVILRDTSFKNDMEKTNAIKKLEQVGISEIRSI